MGWIFYSRWDNPVGLRHGVYFKKTVSHVKPLNFPVGGHPRLAVARCPR